MKRFLLLLQLAVIGLAVMLASGCASNDDASSEDNLSGLPWNRPLPGEAGQRFGGFPQSH